MLASGTPRRHPGEGGLWRRQLWRPQHHLGGVHDGCAGTASWDADFRRFGESCDGQADPTNAAWTVRGTDVGRYTCIVEDSVGTPRAAILAVNEQKAFEAELVAVRPDWPYQIPRNQPELIDWFIKQNSGSFWR